MKQSSFVRDETQRCRSLLIRMSTTCFSSSWLMTRTVWHCNDLSGLLLTLVLFATAPDGTGSTDNRHVSLQQSKLFLTRPSLYSKHVCLSRFSWLSNLSGNRLVSLPTMYTSFLALKRSKNLRQHINITSSLLYTKSIKTTTVKICLSNCFKGNSIEIWQQKMTMHFTFIIWEMSLFLRLNVKRYNIITIFM